MKIKTEWKNGMQFESQMEKHRLLLDASVPIGVAGGPTPLQALLSALTAASGMDIVGLLKKNKQQIDKFEIDTIGELNQNHYPVVLDLIELIYKLEGNIDEFIAREAIHLSHFKFCGILNMISQSVHIHWRFFLNGEEMAEESADGLLSLE
jgi:putative redox protein